MLFLIFNNQSLSSVSCIQLILFPILSDPHHFPSVCHLPSENQSSSGIVNVSRSTFHVPFMLWMFRKRLLLNIAGNHVGLWVFDIFDHCNYQNNCKKIHSSIVTDIIHVWPWDEFYFMPSLCWLMPLINL